MPDERQDDEQQDQIGKVDINLGAESPKDAASRPEMPLRVLVLGDFTPDAPEVEDWETSSRLVNVTPRDFESVMQQLEPRLAMDVPNCLSDSPKELTVELKFTDMKSLRPEGIAQQVDALASLLEVRGLVSQLKERKLTLEEFEEKFPETGMDPAWLEQFHKMLSALPKPEPAEKGPEPPSDQKPKPEDGGLGSLLDMVDVDDEKTTQAPGKRPAAAGPVGDLVRAVAGQKKVTPKADRSAIDLVLEELDQKLSDQINHVLHNSKFQQAESSWRGLKFLVDRTDFRENIKIEILSVHKDQLRDAIYHQVFNPEYNELTESPLSVMIADYEFNRLPEDMELLGDIAQMAASIQVPFIASVGPAFFGGKTSADLARIPLMRTHFQEADYAQWNAFRDREDSQYISLTTPRFLLRFPYGPDGIKVKEFNFVERVASSADHLWGRGAFAVAATVVRSFVEDGWCIGITGMRGGGIVENLPVWTYRVARRDVRIPLDAVFTQTREQEIVGSGFVLLSSRINENNACVLAAPTAHRPKQYDNPEETKEAYMHATLPYQLFASRMAHYLRRIVDEISTGVTREQAQMAFVGKLRSILAKPGAELSPESVMVQVSDNEENPDYYNVVMLIRPPFQILGSNVDLILGIQLHR